MIIFMADATSFVTTTDTIKKDTIDKSNLLESYWTFKSMRNVDERFFNHLVEEKDDKNKQK